MLLYAAKFSFERMCSLPFCFSPRISLSVKYMDFWLQNSLVSFFITIFANYCFNKKRGNEIC